MSFIFGSLHCFTFTNQMNTHLQTHSWAKIARSQVVSFGESVVQIPWQQGKQDRVQGSTNRASVIEGNSSQPSRSPLEGCVLFLATAWPHRDIARLESGKFPSFVVLGWFTSFKVFSDLFPLDKGGFLSIACWRINYSSVAAWEPHTATSHIWVHPHKILVI